MARLTHRDGAHAVVLAIVDPASSKLQCADMPGGGVPAAAFEAFVLMTLAVIGSVMASRQPRKHVGWILAA